MEAVQQKTVSGSTEPPSSVSVTTLEHSQFLTTLTYERKQYCIKLLILCFNYPPVFSRDLIMGGQGFFSSFVATLWDFYGGMFRLTLFLPFTLLQVEVIIRIEGEI